ncbi:hypothetical protein [Olleya sp. Bg11-27]|uniref:hypothetical protein n=1 Tax=Olleya sp. Bg11-27 TaxID=2058135 RepID=UPI000C30447C|nr:hypothetical protein [Olleya sp. Bg11-27]AUC76955.1 hypothetical protein CW732_15230 [Olleya sp. Bg11-27]
MDLIGFMFFIVLAFLVFFYRKKINKRHLRLSIISIIVSVPAYVAILFTLKKIDFTPNKKLVIGIYVSFVIILMFIIILFVVKVIWDFLIQNQVKIGNKEKPFIKKIIKRKTLIITIFHMLFFLGVCLGLFGMWFNSNTL